MKRNTCVDILENKWISVSKMPKIWTFPCLIKFREHDLHGLHISTGVWWAHYGEFSIDNREMKNFTPEYFIPIYDDLSGFDTIEYEHKIKTKEK